MLLIVYVMFTFEAQNIAAVIIAGLRPATRGTKFPQATILLLRSSRLPGTEEVIDYYLHCLSKGKTYGYHHHHTSNLYQFGSLQLFKLIWSSSPFALNLCWL